MSGETYAAEGRLLKLRRAFDETFAAPVADQPRELQSLLAIRVSGEALALKTADLAGLVSQRRITPVPSRIPELLGIAGVRGALVPVFELAALLGLSRPQAEPCWLALTDAPLALAFEDLEGQIQVAPECLYADEDHRPWRHIRQLVRTGSTVRAVVDVPALVQSLRKRAGLSAPAQE